MPIDGWRIHRRIGMSGGLFARAVAREVGRPLVATDVPGCRDIARADLNALLVPVEDPEALANAIDRLARDPQLRRKFGRAGRELVEQNFSSKRIGRDVIALYQRLLAQTA